MYEKNIHQFLCGIKKDARKIKLFPFFCLAVKIQFHYYSNFLMHAKTKYTKL